LNPLFPHTPPHPHTLFPNFQLSAFQHFSFFSFPPTHPHTHTLSFPVPSISLSPAFPPTLPSFFVPNDFILRALRAFVVKSTAGSRFISAFSFSAFLF
jgi:hypothetical protein